VTSQTGVKRRLEGLQDGLEHAHEQVSGGAGSF
jgi:hypothetical protein